MAGAQAGGVQEVCEINNRQFFIYITINVTLVEEILIFNEEVKASNLSLLWISLSYNIMRIILVVEGLLKFVDSPLKSWILGPERG